MLKIYSSINNEVIHIYYTKNEINGRTDIVNEKEFIQVASISLSKDQTFKPHKHKWKKINYDMSIAQESWVVLQGSVEVTYYDIDGSLITKKILNEGDCTITLQGGHNYKSLTNDTLVYEFKTGPYEGQNIDKEFI